MSNVLQYVGARYVPILFTNAQGTSEWQPNTSYEPLTIVTYNNGSYTSKQQVPNSIGNPTDNPSYWVQTGQFNAQLSAIQKQMNALESQLETDISSLTTSLDSKVQAVSGLNVKTQSTGVIIIGDSFYGGTTWSGGQGARGFFANFLEKTSNVNLWSWCQGGMGAAVTGNNNLYNVVKRFGDPFVLPDGIKIGYILIGIGYNDYTSLTLTNIGTASIAIGDTASYLRSKFPDAQIVLLNLMASNYGTKTPLVRRCYAMAAANYQLDFIDGAGNVLRTFGYLADDGIHPTLQGLKQLVANNVAQVFYGMDYATEFVFNSITMKVSGNVGMLSAGSIIATEFTDGICNGQNTVGTLSITESQLQEANLGDYYCNGFITDSNGTKTCPMVLRIRDGKVAFRPALWQGSGFYYTSGLTAVAVFGFQGTFLFSEI